MTFINDELQAILLKALAVFFVLLWLWGTMPRLRIDQMLGFNWKFLVPVSLVNVCMVALVGKALPPTPNPWVQAGALLGSNVILALAVLAAMGAGGAQLGDTPGGIQLCPRPCRGRNATPVPSYSPTMIASDGGPKGVSTSISRTPVMPSNW
mgnify:CR=1 FL=1